MAIGRKHPEVAALAHVQYSTVPYCTPDRVRLLYILRFRMRDVGEARRVLVSGARRIGELLYD